MIGALAAARAERFTVDSDVAGTVKRQWFCLNTKDPETAERLRDQLNANASPAPPTSPHAAQTVKERGVPWHAARKARGVKQWDSERGWLENHIYPKIGHLPIGTVRPAHIMEVVNAAMEKELAPATIEHIRSTMNLLFDEAWRLSIIPENPVLEVKVPPIAYVEKPRVILADDEVLVFWACEDAELEIRMLGLVARCEGGMRTRDCTWWDCDDDRSRALRVVHRSAHRDRQAPAARHPGRASGAASRVVGEAGGARPRARCSR